MQLRLASPIVGLYEHSPGPAVRDDALKRRLQDAAATQNRDGRNFTLVVQPGVAVILGCFDSERFEREI